MRAVTMSRGPRGVTLIELILTLVVLAVLVAVLAPVMSAGINAYIEGRQLAERERQASLALERFVRDVRSAANVTQPEDKILTIDPQDDGEPKYQYTLDNGELRRGGQTIAAGVEDASFFKTTVGGATLWTVELTIQGLPTYQATGWPRS